MGRTHHSEPGMRLSLTAVNFRRIMLAIFDPAAFSPATLPMSSVDHHPERNVIRVQLKQNVVLKGLNEREIMELEPYLTVADCQQGGSQLPQGGHDVEQD